MVHEQEIQTPKEKHPKKLKKVDVSESEEDVESQSRQAANQLKKTTKERRISMEGDTPPKKSHSSRQVRSEEVEISLNNSLNNKDSNSKSNRRNSLESRTSSGSSRRKKKEQGSLGVDLWKRVLSQF